MPTNNLSERAMSSLRVPMFFMAIASLLLSVPMPGAAQDGEPPYWVSLKVDRANMRVGPDRSYPIDWVYVRLELPLKVVRKSGGWRLVEDQDGARGWMLARFLSRDRTATVTVEGLAEIRDDAGVNAKLLWRAQPGVIGRLGECENGWCEIAIGDKRGWIAAEDIWGEGAP